MSVPTVYVPDAWSATRDGVCTELCAPSRARRTRTSRSLFRRSPSDRSSRTLRCSAYSFLAASSHSSLKRAVATDAPTTGMASRTQKTSRTPKTSRTAIASKGQRRVVDRPSVVTRIRRGPRRVAAPTSSAESTPVPPRFPKWAWTARPLARPRLTAGRYPSKPRRHKCRRATSPAEDGAGRLRPDRSCGQRSDGPQRLPRGIPYMAAGR